jgi:hypothetical protein
LKAHSQQITVDWSDNGVVREALMSLIYADGTHNFNLTFFKIFVLILIVSALLLLNIISISLNLRIPQANLHAALHFVHVKIFWGLVGTVAQH